MADAEKPETNKQKYPLNKVDPKTVAKVDRMMNADVDHPRRSKNLSAANGPAGAPLLPDEKLPDFDKRSSKDRPKTPAPQTDNKTKTIDQAEAEANKRQEQSASDPETDKAIDEITREESDRVLAIEDAKAELFAEGSAEIDRGFWNRLKSKITAFWHNKKARNSSLTVVFVVIIAIAALPGSRYFILNSLGVRASMSIHVIDDKTDQPLKNVDVAIGGSSTKTDIEGNAKLAGLRLGKNQLSVKKPAFADINENVTIGWGSNPKGDIGLTAVGSRYTFEIKDFVSGKPVGNAEAISGVASATANENGEIVLVVADQNESRISVQIAAANYRSETIDLEVGGKDAHQISLVPARKHAFVSKRSGKYDLYKVDVDGKNEHLVLAGTGTESEDSTVILSGPGSNTIAYLSTRGDRHNQDGFALSDLMIINLDDDKATTIDYSERFQLVDFIGSKLLYVKIAEGQSGSSPKRHKLISYDINTKQKKVLVKTNYFNDILAADGSIYYAPSQYKSKTDGVGLFKTNAEGSAKATIYNKEVWNLFRVSYQKIDVVVGQDWYEYDIKSGIFNPLSDPPGNQNSRVYVDSLDGNKSAWIDERDGKGVLLVYDKSSGQDTVIQKQSGLANPISWLDNDHLVYRIANNSETADYVISLSGGSPKKIQDVTNTAGLDRWYYY